MYLSSNNCFELDKILKSFEVAYRSYVADIVINKYSKEENFKLKLEELKTLNKASSLANSNLYQSKTSTLLNTYKEIYSTIKYSSNCNSKNDYDENEVLYVGQLIDLVVLFFNPDFFDLSKNFESTNEFIYYSTKYQKIRNTLAHPASSKIKKAESNEVIKYITLLMKDIDSKYFWYISKDLILIDIAEYESKMSKNPFKIQNLNEIDIEHKKLICREKELLSLKEIIIGKDVYYRRAGSVVLYGYGGVGKTALLLEFINELIKDIIDNKLSCSIEFLLFFSSKEEKLNYSMETGDLYISEIRKQVQSFEDFKNKIFKYLNVEDEIEFKRFSGLEGIVVIDNIETFSNSDKEKFLDFIRMSPRNIQYIITSRNEEKCEEKMYIESFSESNKGVQFINQYIEENGLDISISDTNIKELIRSSKGNTLILVLAMARLDQGKTTFENIIYELSNVAVQNAEIIADFMYKNTFDQTIDELEQREHDPIKLLRIVSLYDEPVDMLTISLLTNINLGEVEFMCKTLTTRLILNKVEELFTLNEFANKFIFIKLMPNSTEKLKISKAINEYKDNVKANLEKLDQNKKKSALFLEIMNDWKPKTYIDKLAISEVFNFYGIAYKIAEYKNDKNIVSKIENLDKKFIQYELNTSHPYIRYQKARSFHLFITKNIEYPDLCKIVKDYYEKTFLSIQYEYTYIKMTNSYAHLLWIYGTFLRKEFGDYENAFKNFQESKIIFEKLSVKSESYYKVISEICVCSSYMYKETKDLDYMKLLKENSMLLQNNINKFDSIPKFIKWFNNTNKKTTQFAISKCTVRV